MSTDVKYLKVNNGANLLFFELPPNIEIIRYYLTLLLHSGTGFASSGYY